MPTFSDPSGSERTPNGTLFFVTAPLENCQVKGFPGGHTGADALDNGRLCK